MSERKKILWLVSWYPNRYDPFDGDFIQRHVRAAALFDDITVLFIKQTAEQKKPETVVHRQEGLTEWLLYLPKKKGWLGKADNFYRWQKACRQAVDKIISHERPQLVHVHIPWKMGLSAIWIKKKYRIPYLVTEHWGIYNRVVEDNVHNRSLLFRRLLKIIYREARLVVSVSRFLGEGINRFLHPTAYTVVPNVVDTALFFPVAAKSNRFTFLHVSNMVPLKNVEGILQAFQQFLARENSGAQLVLIGNRDPSYEQLAEEMGLLNRSVFFRGEMPYAEVAGEMRMAHVLVLNSDMENSPCVIGEALCCGLPVIATKVGGIPELLALENGLLVPPRNVAALTEAFAEMEKRYPQFHLTDMTVSSHKKFSMAAVGQRLHLLYGD